MGKFVVRANNYSYNDENYFIESPGKLEAIFDTYDEAIKACNAFSVDAFQVFDNGQLPEFLFNAPEMEAKIEALKYYYKKHFDVEVNVTEEDFMSSIPPPPPTASQQELLEILQILGIRFFDVYEFEIEQPMYEIQYNPGFWGKMDYDPFMSEYGRSFYFNSEDAFNFAFDKINEAFWSDMPGLKGTLEELSDHTDLLRAFLEGSQNVEFKPGTGIAMRHDHYSVTKSEIHGLIDLLKMRPYNLIPVTYTDAVKLIGTGAPDIYCFPINVVINNSIKGKKWWQFWK